MERQGVKWKGGRRAGMGCDQDFRGQAEPMVPGIWSSGEGLGPQSMVSVELVFKATVQGGGVMWEGVLA